jgi:transglutaminase-like putative cysteine protease
MTLNARMTVTVAVAVVLASTVLYPLFNDGQWFFAGAGAVIVVAGCGALSRLRALPVAACLAISLLGLLLYLNLVFEAHYSLIGIIPTPNSVARLWDLLGTGMRDSGRYAPPAPVLPGLLLVAVGGIGLMAVAADLIAVRLRSTALAGLPLLVLFTVPITMRAPSGPGTVVVFCLGTAGYLAMLSADGRERIRVWGRLVSLWRSGPQDGGPRGLTRPGRVRQAAEPEPGPDTRAMAAAGRRVGLASMVLALSVPLILPGLHASKLFSTGPGIGGTGGTAPAVSLPDTLGETLRELQENHPTTVLTYTITTSPARQETNDPQYLREVVYDNLTDSGWQSSDYSANDAQATTLMRPDGLASPTIYPQITVTVNVENNVLTNQKYPTFLPVPYPPAQVTTPPGTWLADSELMVFSQDDSVPVSTYQATSYQVIPTAAELNSAARPPASLAPDVALPSSYKDQALMQIADRITKGDTTEYAKVNALATYLSSTHFAYSANAPSFNSAAGLLTFLTTGRTGVCVQYAYAMTVLTRLLGIPARIASGFTGGSHTTGNHYVVQTDDSHAWPEVYFSGYGWLRFEPTPSGGDGTAVANSYQGQTLVTGPGGNQSNNPQATPTPTPTKSSASTGLPGTHRFTGGAGGGSVAAAKSAGAPWGAIALAVIAAIALACGVISIIVPPGQRVMSPHDRRPPVSLTTVVLVIAAAAIVALVMYRLLAHTSGLDLGVGWATVGIAFGAAAGVMLVAPAIIRVVLRRWRWMVATDDASRAHTAWREFRDDLADLGVGCRPSEPPRTLAERVTSGLPGRPREAIRRLALAEERATYAARPSPGAALRKDGRAARRGLAASVRRGARWRARIFPASVVTTLVNGAIAIPDGVTALLSRRWVMRRSAS